MTYILTSEDRRKLEEALALGRAYTEAMGALRAEADLAAALSLLAGLPNVQDEDAKHAARWKWFRGQTGAGLKDIGSIAPSFRPPKINPVRGANIMRGSVAQHLDAAVDAAMKEHPQP